MAYMRTFFKALCLLLIITVFVSSSTPLWSSEYDDLTHELEETKRLLDSSKSATDINEKTLKSMNDRIAGIRAKVANLEEEIARKQKEIENGDKNLTVQKGLFDVRVINHYKRLKQWEGGVMSLFTGDNLSSDINRVVYLDKMLQKDKEVIVDTALYVKDSETKKQEFENETKQLASIKTELDRQSDFLNGEVTSAKKYQEDLQRKIADLSTRQQAILSAKAGNFSASAGDVEYDDYNASREFSPGFSPAFAAFSIGAYTHRKGMSQYGAKGRADAGQSYTDILKHYFPDTSLETKGDLPGNISVGGSGDISLEDNYLLGIAEMPSSWHPEALKAQAIAARTYAMYYIGWPDRSGTICTTQSCQVYLPSKAASSPQAWKDAVNATRGQILMKDGKPAPTWYSSTAGGYLVGSGWDTNDGQATNFLQNAWEKIAKSPWFYKAWYRESYPNNSDSCGRSHPWLTGDEMADVVNAWIVRKGGNGDEVSRILPTTLGSCSISGQSGNPYSRDELASVADKYGGRVTSVGGVGVNYANDGFTGSVNFETNRGSISIPGSEFKESFNLRAPGYLSIRNALFAIEKK